MTNEIDGCVEYGEWNGRLELYATPVELKHISAIIGFTNQDEVYYNDHMYKLTTYVFDSVHALVRYISSKTVVLGTISSSKYFIEDEGTFSNRCVATLAMIDYVKPKNITITVAGITNSGKSFIAEQLALHLESFPFASINLDYGPGGKPPRDRDQHDAGMKKVAKNINVTVQMVNLQQEPRKLPQNVVLGCRPPYPVL